MSIGVRMKSNLPETMGMFEQLKDAALNGVGLEMSGRAKEITPVKTGRLRASITWAANGQPRTHTEATQPRDGAPTIVSYTAIAPNNTVAIGTNVKYAKRQHWGLTAEGREFNYVDPRAERLWLLKTMQRNKARILEIIRATMQGRTLRGG